MIAPTDPRTPRVVLVGPPGAGKSTIGRKLAKELGVDLYDTDAGIERETGRTIPEIFAEDGEPEFRRIEERVVRRAILAERGVVSLGGGAVLSANTRALLRNRTVVYLEISVAEGLRRTGASNQRPLLNGDDPGAKYRELMRTRRPLYREVATVRVRTDGRSPSRVVRMILSRLGIEPVTGDPEPGPPTTTASNPQSTSRSRARRRARARAAARRRAAASAAGGETGSPANHGTPATTDCTSADAPPGSAAAGSTARAFAGPGSTAPGSTAPDAAAPGVGSTNRGSGTDTDSTEDTATSRPRRPRRRRPHSGNRNPAGAPSNTVRGVADTSQRTASAARPGADQSTGKRQSGSGTRLTETGTQPSGTDPRPPGTGASARGDSPPTRSRRSARRRAGSDRSRVNRTQDPGSSVGQGNPDATTAPERNRPVDPPGAQVGTRDSAVGGSRSRRARARRTRNGGSGDRGNTSGVRGNAPSARGGVQNARGGSSKQTARTESEQQS